MKVNIRELHAKTDNLTLYIFNVGQGDHILFKFPSSEYGIIDFNYDENLNLYEPPALSYFKALKMTLNPEEFKSIKISFICISHTHKDHLKGINESLDWFKENNIPIGSIWLSGIKETILLQKTFIKNIDDIWNKLPIEGKVRLSKIFEDLKGIDETGQIPKFYYSLDYFKNKNSTNLSYIQYIKNIRQIIGVLIPNVKFYCLGPLDGHLQKLDEKFLLEYSKWCLGIDNLIDRSEYNILSHILLLKFNSNSLLFGGDTEYSIWEDCIKAYDENGFVNEFGQLESTFVKVGHHGAKNASDIKLWKRILDPMNAVHLAISAGRNKKYNHPNSETLIDIGSAETILDNKVNLYSTNICKSKINKMNINKEIHDWIEQSQALYDEDVYDWVTKSLRNKIIEIEATKDEYNLLGYKFEFDEKSNKTLSVKAILSKSIGGYTHCKRCNNDTVDCENCKLLLIRN